MQLFDMHSHILPGIDDGAKTVEDSLELLSCLKNQGVTNTRIRRVFRHTKGTIRLLILYQQSTSLRSFL